MVADNELSDRPVLASMALLIGRNVKFTETIPAADRAAISNICAPQSTPTAAEHQRVAAVVSPVTTRAERSVFQRVMREIIARSGLW